jgi:hypothetical protein
MPRLADEAIKHCREFAGASYIGGKGVRVADLCDDLLEARQQLADRKTKKESVPGLGPDDERLAAIEKSARETAGIPGVDVRKLIATATEAYWLERDRLEHQIAVEQEAGVKVLTLVRNAVCNARPRGPGRHVRWSAVSDALAVGSTSAIALCRIFDRDPHEQLEGPVCEYCATTDNSAYHTLNKIGEALNAHDDEMIVDTLLTIQLAYREYLEEQSNPPDRSLSQITREICDFLVKTEGFKYSDHDQDGGPGYYSADGPLGLAKDGEDKVRLL